MHDKYSKLQIAALISGFVAVMTVVSCRPRPEPREVRVGVVVALTGEAAQPGKWARNGVDLAIVELNQQSRQSGLRFVALYEDHHMDVKQGVSAFKKLVEVNHVAGAVTADSGVALAVAPEADQTKTLQLNCASVSSAICGSGKYTFTFVNNTDVETKEVAKLAFEQLQLKKVAILYANTGDGVTRKETAVRSFIETGGDILGAVAFPEGFTNLPAQLLILKEMNPPAVCFIGTMKDFGRLLKHAQELGFKTQWLTSSVLEDPELLRIAGSAAEGIIYTSDNLFDLPNLTDRSREFLNSYTSQYGERPNLAAAAAYDAIRLLAAAESLPDRSPEGLQKFFSSVKDFQGASGLVALDKNGCTRKTVFLKMVHDSRFVVYQK